MSRAISRPTITKACLDAVKEAEHRHAEWSGGITMRAAPESLVQAIVAEILGKAGARLLLEVSVDDLTTVAAGGLLPLDPIGKGGRVDLAVYYKSKAPRFVVEIKKIQSGKSLLADCRRIHDLLGHCPTLQNGLMLGYTVAAKVSTVQARLDAVSHVTGSRIIRHLEPMSVMSKLSLPRLLGAALYRVDRAQPRP